MKLTPEQIDIYKDMINSAEYALIKQVSSVSLQSNYADIQLLESEHEKLQIFLNKMLNKRIKDLSKQIEKSNKIK